LTRLAAAPPEPWKNWYSGQPPVGISPNGRVIASVTSASPCAIGAPSSSSSKSPSVSNGGSPRWNVGTVTVASSSQKPSWAAPSSGSTCTSAMVASCAARTASERACSSAGSSPVVKTVATKRSSAARPIIGSVSHSGA
jgi:hypothetical protein